MKPITCITPRTDAEWPQDHPLRKMVQTVMSDALVAKMRPGEAVLVCSIEGEPRNPAPADDRDIHATCAWCPTKIVYRASAPANLTPICPACYGLVR